MRETAYGEFRQRRQETLWHRLNRLLWAAVALVVLAIAAWCFLPLIGEKKQQRIRVEALQSQIEAQRRDLSRREREVKLLQNDPAYIELMARDRLEQMKPGETIFRLDPPPPDTSDFKRVPAP